MSEIIDIGGTDWIRRGFRAMLSNEYRDKTPEEQEKMVQQYEADLIVAKTQWRLYSEMNLMNLLAQTSCATMKFDDYN